MEHSDYLDQVHERTLKCIETAFNNNKFIGFVWKEFDSEQQKFFQSVCVLFKERVHAFFDEVTEEKYFKPYNNIMVTHRIIIGELQSMISFLTFNVIETLTSSFATDVHTILPELDFKFDHNKRMIRTICVVQYCIKQYLKGYLVDFLASGISIFIQGEKREVALGIDIPVETLPFYTEEWDQALKYYQQLKEEVGTKDYKLPKIVFENLHK